MKLKDHLQKMEACGPAIKWVGNKTLYQAWRQCKRADWMLWLVAKMCQHPKRKKLGWPTHKQVVLAACDCAETSLIYVPNDEQRPANAIKTTRAWCRGRATIKEVKKAYDAAYAAAYAYAAYAAYAYAAYAAAYADAAAADAAAAYAYAAYAAAAAADAAAADADAAADAAIHKKMCKLIRKRLKPGRLPND